MDENRVREILDFSRNFTDRCHHGKEERYYFPAAQVYVGQRVYGFIDELEVEHAYGRSIMDEIDYLLGSDGARWPGGSPSVCPMYVSTMRRHISSEEQARRLSERGVALLPPRARSDHGARTWPSTGSRK